MMMGKNCLVYSVGSNNDIAFEKAVHTFMKGCEIHTFDPTLNKPFVGGEYAIFHPWGLGLDGVKAAARGNSWEGKSFETVFKELAHENRTVDVLKIDCEGCEWDVMPPLFELMSTGRVKVDQILIELHLPKLKNNITKLKNFFWAADKAKIRLFHKERNGWGAAEVKDVGSLHLPVGPFFEKQTVILCVLKLLLKGCIELKAGRSVSATIVQLTAQAIFLSTL